MRRPFLRRLVSCAIVASVWLGAAGCSGDDDSASGSDESSESSEPPARFCDVYLGYLSEPTAQQLDAVAAAAGDDQVGAYVEIITSDADITAVLAATLDLDDLARTECQPEWTAGAQGAGNTGAAAQAFYDALVAGDRLGVQNVAAANAIAVFEPWEPRAVDPATGTPAIGDLDGQSFTIALDPATLAECQVETGVVVSCQIAE